MAGGTGTAERLSGLRAFAAEAAARAEESLAAAGATLEGDLVLAGRRIRVHGPAGAFTERLIAPYGPRFGPADGGEPPVATVLALHDGVAERPLPPPPWGAGDYGQLDGIAGIEPGLHAAYQLEQHVLAVGADATGVVWARDPTLLPEHEFGALARNLFSWALGEPPLLPVHGAVVGSGGVGVLVAGMGGAGKSTTVLACLERGMELVGDDHCLLDPGPPAVAHALYAYAKLTEDGRRRLPELAARARGRVLDKLLVPLDGELASRCAEAQTLGAVVLPRLGATPGLRPAPPGGALVALASATFFLPPAQRGTAVRALSAMARALPVYELGLSEDLDEVHSAVRGLVEAMT